jgi:hypothetical protein
MHLHTEFNTARSNTSLGKDAMNRVSTDGLFVAFFFQIGIKGFFFPPPLIPRGDPTLAFSPKPDKY